MTARDAALMDRRRLLQGSVLAGGLSLLGGCASRPVGRPSSAGAFLPLAPVRAGVDRIFDVTVCLRPFRAAGPRLEAERIGDTLVVHNYGHGGSGWSLSWGSGTLAVRMAMAGSPAEVAVLGCGALGLTAAILAQRAGARVTIYAREFMPETRSARATGTWSPDSRVALASVAGPGFASRWEEMARTSFKAYRNYLGLPGDPVAWTDRYTVTDTSLDDPAPAAAASDALDFARYRNRIRDLTPRPERLPTASTPFDAAYVYRSEEMMFNIADYGHTLLNDFLVAGGQLRRVEFHAPGELMALKEKVVINCPGYGGRALWKDETITPVRGQIAWLIPQPEVTYGLYYRDVLVLSRRDGIVVQDTAGGDMRGYGDDRETPDRAEADDAVRTIETLFATRFRPGPQA